MDKSKMRRWSILLTAVAVTAAFSFYPTEDNTLINSHRPGKKAESSKSATPSAVIDAIPMDEQDSLDPFAPRGWQPPPPVAVAAAAPIAVPVAPALPPAPAGPPPLPFKFMGAMNEDGALTIYLSKGDEALVAHVGDVLDGSYKVLDLDNQHIDFEYKPTGDKQTLTFPSSEN